MIKENHIKMCITNCNEENHEKEMKSTATRHSDNSQQLHEEMNEAGPHPLTLGNLEDVPSGLEQQVIAEIRQVFKHVVTALPHALKHHIWVVG